MENKDLHLKENTTGFPLLPGLTADGQCYFNAEMGTVEAAIPNGGWLTCHGPGMVELPNGDLLCCWFAGTFEGDTDVHIVCSRLPKGESKWTEPVDVSNDNTRSEQNPSLFYGPDGAVWCMYTAQRGRRAGEDNTQFTAQIRCQKSFDGGLTWSEPETIFPEEGTFSRQPIQILSNGRWIYGNWICRSANGLAGDPSAFRISDDGGKTWTDRIFMPNSNGCVHPTIIECFDVPGHLVAFMRSRKADFIYRSESFDWGSSWAEPKPTPLPNNNSSISAIRTQSGRIAIAYNPTCVPEDYASDVAWPGLRCPVAVALSEDNGLTFPMIRWMDRGEGFIGAENACNNRQYEYPYIMQSKDGRLHLTSAAFTRVAVKYVSFTEEDVMGEKRERYSVYNPTSGEGARERSLAHK